MKMLDLGSPTSLDVSQMLGFDGEWRGRTGLLNVIHHDLNGTGSRSTIVPPFRFEDESTQLREWIKQGSGSEREILLLLEEQEHRGG